MSKIDNGGPAFPVPLNPGETWREMASCDGMTLRDYFAAKAMQGILAAGRDAQFDGSDMYGYARASYGLADAMLKAREVSS